MSPVLDLLLFLFSFAAAGVAAFGIDKVQPLPTLSGTALTFARTTSLSFDALREQCPQATGELAVCVGGR